MAELVALLTAWDEMDNAAQRMETALPSQMSAAVARLEGARLQMRAAIQRFAVQQSRGEA
jgi:hypothetical protein